MEARIAADAAAVAMDDKARERYWWDHLVGTKQKSQQAHDDGILKVCGGSLGVSFAFVSNFIEGSPASVWLLLLAWACWALALVVVIASHRYSTLAADAALETMRRQRISGLAEGPGPDDSWQNRIVKKLNTWGWILFAAGVIFLGGFVYLNTQQKPHDGQEQHEVRHEARQRHRHPTRPAARRRHYGRRTRSRHRTPAGAQSRAGFGGAVSTGQRPQRRQEGEVT